VAVVRGRHKAVATAVVARGRRKAVATVVVAQKARGWRRRGRAGGGRRWHGCVQAAEGGESEDGSGGAGAREIYDRWTPRIFLSPVDPTLRVRTPVDCVGVVYPRLHQICF
jgi:hypothetical protein